MRVLVFEPRFRGHPLFYVRLVLEGLPALAESVILATTPQAAASEEFAAHVAPLAGTFTLDATLTPYSGAGARSWWDLLAQLDAAIARHRVDHVLIPSADGLVTLSGVARALRRFPRLRRVEIEANLIRASFGYPGEGRLGGFRQAIQRCVIAASPFSSLRLIDFVAWENLRVRHPALAARFQVTPDPLDPRPPLPQDEARRRLNLPSRGQIIGSVGAIEARKGILELLAACRRADLSADTRILIMGRFDPEIRARVDADYADLLGAGRLIAIDRFVSDEELNAALSAMDLVCTPYLRHIGPSGIIVRAMAAGRPVLAADYGWSGVAVPRFGLGQVCNVQDPETFAAAIRRGLAEAGGFQLPPIAARLQAFLAPRNFTATWMCRLRQRLGLPLDPDLIQWSDVALPASAAGASASRSG